jgi:DNA primase
MTDNIVIALDADAAGIKAAGKASRAALASGLNVKVAQLPTGLDPADLIQKEGSDAWRTAIRDAKDIITFLLDVLHEHAKSPDVFRRSVEAVVLPFLQDVQSPIAREQYTNEIARRLNVSSAAISQAVSTLPEVAVPVQSVVVTSVSSVATSATIKSRALERARQAFSILLWQRTLPKPEINLEDYEAELKEAVGVELFEQLQGLSPKECESLLFSAERLHGPGTVAASAKSLLRVIVAERLSADLAEATGQLERAEEMGDEEAVERLMAYCKVLTSHIAQLHITV